MHTQAAHISCVLPIPAVLCSAEAASHPLLALACRPSLALRPAGENSYEPRPVMQLRLGSSAGADATAPGSAAVLGEQLSAAGRVSINSGGSSASTGSSHAVTITTTSGRPQDGWQWAQQKGLLPLLADHQQQQQQYQLAALRPLQPLPQEQQQQQQQ